jgi:Nif-specific regulatory protein
MNPRAIAISGPLKGEAFELGEYEFCIGRGSRCDARVDDPSVSARHFSITCHAGQAYLVDLHSNTGTFVNGFRVPGRKLVHGDRIRAGLSILVYQERDDPEAQLLLTPAEEEWNQATRAAAINRGSYVPYVPPSGAILSAFLRMQASITGICDAEGIQTCALDILLEVMPADRTAILLAGHDEHDFVSTIYRSRRSPNGDPFQIDEATARKVLREGVPARGEKVLYYPVTAVSTKVGVIYAAMPADGFEYFTAAHTPLIEWIAGFTAITLEHARYVEWLEGENRRLTEAISIEHGMIGQSARMKEVYEFIEKAAPSGRNVLILGESGTGKELMAHALHRNSQRSARPFYAVNCGAFPETLLESELFGHEKGAFTDAVAQKKGVFELADGGTLFLDEIGELKMPMQSHLLRVLQEGEIKRVGGDRVIRVDVRVIAATNRDLRNEIVGGRFRQDLFFRLDILSVEMPPLSERREDIPLLAAHFIKKHRDGRADHRPAVVGITPEAHRLLASHRWPGNVRELENAIDRAITLGESSYIQPEDFPKTILAGASDLGGVDLYDKELDDFRRKLFERVLRETNGDHRKAADRLALNPRYFAALCRELNVKYRDSRD